MSDVLAELKQVRRNGFEAVKVIERAIAEITRLRMDRALMQASVLELLQQIKAQRVSARETQEEIAVLRRLLGESARREGDARATVAQMTN